MLRPFRPARTTGPLLGLLLLAASGVAEPVDPEPVPPATVEADAPTDVEILERIADGELPETASLARLFTIDLLADGEVQVEVERLRSELAALPPVAEGESPSRQRRERELRLQILTAPVENRKALVNEERQRRESELERERAEAARLAAEEEARTAEAARQAALEAAEAARSATERLFATELARAESIRRDQANLRQRLAELRVTLRGRATEDAAETLRQRIRAARPGAEGNRSLYEECVAAVTQARQALRVALAEIDEPISVPRYTLPDALPREQEFAEQASVLRRAAAEIARDVSGMESETRRLRHDQATSAYRRQEWLNDVRLQALRTLGETDREEVLGLGPVGLAQLQREWDHLLLELAYYRHARANFGFVWASATEDEREFIKGVWDGLRFLLVCLVAVYAFRNGSRWLDRLGTQAARQLRSGVARRWLLAALETIDHLLEELLLVAVALAAPIALGTLARLPEVTLLLRLFLFFALYRLLITVLYRGIAWLSVGRAGLSPRFRALTLRSLRLVGIYGLATAVILVLSAEFLGRGYLYSVVSNVWWLGGIPIAMILVRWWQPDIIQTFLAYRPTGALANAVRATRERWYGFFVAMLAATVLIVVGAIRLAGRFALGFEQTRRALAFLFRRRLERQAEQQGEAEAAQDLPEVLLETLSEAPVEAEALRIDHAPGLDEFLGTAKAWVEGGPLVPTLLVGDTGFGKTSWLRAAAAGLRDAGLRVRVIEPPANAVAGADPLPWVAKALDVPATDWEALAAGLSEREREVVLIDDGHVLFSRRFGGFAAWDRLAACAGAATSRVLWLVALARFPFDYLLWARGSTAPFRHVHRLKPWSDTDIASLLRCRMKAAGFQVRYDDLVVDRVEGVRRRSQLLRTENEYARLIWDYAEGCPRTALRCWRASLRPAGPKSVSVRLFRRPEVERLDELGTSERFVLAALVWHQSITAEVAAEVLRLPLTQCADTLAQLREWKVAWADDGVYRLESDWLQPVRRLLRREHLVVM